MLELISTGGTIACKETGNGLMPALSATELLNIADISPETRKTTFARDLFFMDSSNIQPEEWEKIADAIWASEADGIVLTHGTDTMAYTASMLSYLLLDANKPIVITGSQKPILYPDSDGRANLSAAFSAVKALAPGVYICFGGLIMLGVRAVKTRTISFAAFESINFPYIGTMLNGEFMPFNVARCLKRTGFEKTPIDSNIALIKLIPGLPTAVIDGILLSNLSGLVVEGFGLGGMHNVRRDHINSIHKLIAAGIPVVMKSQCLYEASSVSVYEVSRALYDMGVITVNDMTTEATVTKFMWALGKTHNIERLRDIMNTNFCDDINV
ncbi:MAG: asparaginase [Clostridia bacterium]